MPYDKPSQLSAASSGAETDLLELDAGGTSKSLTLAKFRSLRLLAFTAFTSNGTWTPNALTKYVRVQVIGGGAGGYGGACANDDNSPGGRGGGCGGVQEWEWDITDLPSSVSITIAAQAAGGAAQASYNPSTLIGTDGNTSAFGSLLFARGGKSSGGTAASSLSFFFRGTAMSTPGDGGTGTTTGTANAGERGSAPWAIGGPAGGGGAAGVNGLGTLGTSAAGGAAHNSNGLGLFQQSSVAAGGGPAVGVSGASFTGTIWFGDGGGGGAPSKTANAQAGGDGGIPGGGGGGGGGNNNGAYLSGAGGKGARGEVRVWEYA